MGVCGEGGPHSPGFKLCNERAMCPGQVTSPVSLSIRVFLYQTGGTVKVLVAQSCLTLCDPMDCSPPGSSVQGDSPGKNIGVGCHPWRSSQLSDRTQVSCIAGGFLTI